MTGSPIELVIFDCDGVLVDSEPLSLRILLAMLADHGVKLLMHGIAGFSEGFAPTRPVLRALGVPFCRSLDGVAVGDTALAHMRRDLNAAICRELKPILGIRQTLARLDKPVCVASSSQVERIRLSLDVTGLTSFFHDRVFSATMVDRGKPAPDLFLYAAQQMHTAPEDCMVIEDSPAGISAALTAGMRVLAFTGGSHAQTPSHRDRLAALSPHGVFDDMRALPALLRDLEKGRKVS